MCACCCRVYEETRQGCTFTVLNDKAGRDTSLAYGPGTSVQPLPAPPARPPAALLLPPTPAEGEDVHAYMHTHLQGKRGRTHIYVHACRGGCTYMHACGGPCTYMHACTRMYAYTHMQGKCAQTYYVRSHSRTCMHACMHTGRSYCSCVASLQSM